MKYSLTPARGFTLIETVFAMSLLSVIIGILAFVMSRVMAASSLSATQLETTLTLHTLGEQFRRDAHAATHARIEKPVEGAQRLSIEQGTTVVEYEITPGGVQRSLSVDGQLRTRESFETPGVQIQGWNDDFDQTHELAMHLGRLADPHAHGAALRHKFSIRARLSSDHAITEGRP